MTIKIILYNICAEIFTEFKLFKMTASQGWLLRHLTSTSMGRGHVFEEHDVDSSSLSWSALRSGNLLN